MSAETAHRFDDLEAQAEKLMGVFRAAGFERVAPAILQPASIFLDQVGEDIRSRTYVFADPEGEELCLRPDLTIPVCRIYMSRHPSARAEARYSYNGPLFRYQRGEPNPLRPREFRQAGVESFGAADKLSADIEIFSLTAAAVRAAGLERPELRIGDTGLFRTLLEALPMPSRWRKKLIGVFRRSGAMPEALRRLSAPRAIAPGDPMEPLLAQIRLGDVQGAEALVAEYLDRQGIPFTGARTIGEIAASLAIRKADAIETPLSATAAQLILDYLAVSAPAPEAIARIGRLAADARLDLGAALSALEGRVARLGESGFAPGEAAFSASLGQRFEYYDGFVFELAAGDAAIPAPVASGGRYDGLLTALGAHHGAPAVGAAIYTERLLAAVGGRL